jgi:hypothetical protein
MSRPYPNRRRKRPRPRRRHRDRGGDLPVRPNSYQDFGLRYIYNLIMPDVRGRGRRDYFNRVSVWTILGVGVFGALVGSGSGGLGGAIVGFLIAAGFMAHALTKHRFLR